MTLPASGQIGVSDVSVEIGQSSTYSTNLNFLNNLIMGCSHKECYKPVEHRLHLFLDRVQIKIKEDNERDY